MANSRQESELERLMKERPVKVVAVCSGKGGVGKTNIAANLGVALAGLGRNACVLDADMSLANIDVLLDLQPRFNLADVIRGDADLEMTMLRGPNGLRVVPASSGSYCMTDLPAAAQVGIIQAFSELSDQPQVMIVDTSAGISASVARFVQAAHHPIVTVCDEPASLTDAYALMKVFSNNYGISHFHIVTNQTRSTAEGRRLFAKLSRVADSYLDVVLRHIGNIPYDEYLLKAVQEQRAVVEAYPRSESGQALAKLARNVDALPAAKQASGGIEFFFERLLAAGNTVRGKVA